MHKRGNPQESKFTTKQGVKPYILSYWARHEVSINLKCVLNSLDFLLTLNITASGVNFLRCANAFRLKWQGCAVITHFMKAKAWQVKNAKFQSPLIKFANFSKIFLKILVKIQLKKVIIYKSILKFKFFRCLWEKI